jgi:hypothetical protein
LKLALALMNRCSKFQPEKTMPKKNKKILPYHSMPGTGNKIQPINSLVKLSNDGRKITVAEVEHNKDTLFISCMREHDNGNTYDLRFLISKGGARQLWELIGDKLFAGK